jgi:HEAT repeat protein
LLRSTQKSIEASLGEGTLVGGRGLPRDLSKVKLRGGKLVVESKPTEVDNLLGLLDESGAASESLDALLDDPAALKVADVGPDQARRLQQVVRTGPAGARILAVRALAKLRSMDYAPTLIFALTDPDKRVVREARDGLRSISRNFEGFGPPDNFDDAERDKSVERWKAWYAKVRPDAPPLP